jgi:hypothetical protein
MHTKVKSHKDNRRGKQNAVTGEEKNIHMTLEAPEK